MEPLPTVHRHGGRLAPGQLRRQLHEDLDLPGRRHRDVEDRLLAGHHRGALRERPGARRRDEQSTLGGRCLQRPGAVRRDGRPCHDLAAEVAVDVLDGRPDRGPVRIGDRATQRPERRQRDSAVQHVVAGAQPQGIGGETHGCVQRPTVGGEVDSEVPTRAQAGERTGHPVRADCPLTDDGAGCDLGHGHRAAGHAVGRGQPDLERGRQLDLQVHGHRATRTDPDGERRGPGPAVGREQSDLVVVGRCHAADLHVVAAGDDVTLGPVRGRRHDGDATVVDRLVVAQRGQHGPGDAGGVPTGVGDRHAAGTVSQHRADRGHLGGALGDRQGARVGAGVTLDQGDLEVAGRRGVQLSAAVVEPRRDGHQGGRLAVRLAGGGDLERRTEQEPPSTVALTHPGDLVESQGGRGHRHRIGEGRLVARDHDVDPVADLGVGRQPVVDRRGCGPVELGDLLEPRTEIPQDAVRVRRPGGVPGQVDEPALAGLGDEHAPVLLGGRRQLRARSRRLVARGIHRHHLQQVGRGGCQPLEAGREGVTLHLEDLDAVAQQAVRGDPVVVGRRRPGHGRHGPTHVPHVQAGAGRERRCDAVDEVGDVQLAVGEQHRASVGRHDGGRCVVGAR